MKHIVTTILILIFSSITVGQTKKYVEELALYHLDSLTKIDPLFKDFKYFTNGYVDKFKTTPDDTALSVIKVKPTPIIKTPFNDLIVVEDTTIKFFSIPRRLRKNRGHDVLDIYKFLKVGQEYFVYFRIPHKDGGQTALVVMDIKGNLIRRGRGYYIF